MIINLLITCKSRFAAASSIRHLYRVGVTLWYSDLDDLDHGQYDDDVDGNDDDDNGNGDEGGEGGEAPSQKTAFLTLHWFVLTFCKDVFLMCY